MAQVPLNHRKRITVTLFVVLIWGTLQFPYRSTQIGCFRLLLFGQMNCLAKVDRPYTVYPQSTSDKESHNSASSRPSRGRPREENDSRSLFQPRHIFRPLGWFFSIVEKTALCFPFHPISILMHIHPSLGPAGLNPAHPTIKCTCQQTILIMSGCAGRSLATMSWSISLQMLGGNIWYYICQPLSGNCLQELFLLKGAV